MQSFQKREAAQIWFNEHNTGSWKDTWDPGNCNQGLKVLNYFSGYFAYSWECEHVKKYCKDEVKRKHGEYQAKCLIV